MPSLSLRSTRVCIAAGVLAMSTAAWCDAAGSDGIYSCTDANGRRLTSDRPIPECTNREQRVLNHDGSVQRVVPPTMTADERAEVEAREQRKLAERRTQQDLVRADRNLLARYPDINKHAKARAAALDDARSSVRTTEQRLKLLATERKPLDSEAEFYVGRQMPAMLRQQIDANDASSDALRSLLVNQQAEIQRISASFDVELARLKQLWGGAAPGSLGPMEPLPPKR